MKILVASDLSARSDRALSRGFRLAKDLNADLRILHVVDGDLPEPIKQHSVAWAKDALKRESDALSAATGIVPSIEVTAAKVKQEIIRQSGAEKADLIVLGIHNQAGPAARSFANTTAGLILKSTLTPMLLVKDDCSEPYRNVLVGVDFSGLSKAAIRQATKVAPSASCITLVHAYHMPFKGFLGRTGVPDEIAYDERLKFDQFLKSEMDNLDQRAQQLGISSGALATKLKEGDAQAALRSECKDAGADLLVIATHSRPGLSRAIWGSVAEDLLNDPPCDLLVIKPY